MENEVSGRCLCGDIRFVVRGPFSAFRLCYCSRCRHSTGSAHAANLFTESNNIEWVAGAEQVRRFDLPDAERFSRCFCGRCGSPVPCKSRDGKQLLIPAGSLDEDPGSRPQARIFWAGRAVWYDAGLTCPEYPGTIQQPNR